MERWITSDTHFGHNKIIEYNNRPFDNIDEHDEALIELWNSLVGKKDEIYHLGDFAWRGKSFIENIFAKLNGQKFLVKGSHDKTISKGWKWVKESYNLKISDEISIFMSHHAHRVWPTSHYGTLHAYGHSHGHLPPFGRSCDVGVDSWDFMPVNVDELMTFLTKIDKPVLNHKPDRLVWHGPTAIKELS